MQVIVSIVHAHPVPLERHGAGGGQEATGRVLLHVALLIAHAAAPEVRSQNGVQKRHAPWCAKKGVDNSERLAQADICNAKVKV